MGFSRHRLYKKNKFKIFCNKQISNNNLQRNLQRNNKIEIINFKILKIDQIPQKKNHMIKKLKIKNY